MKVLGISGSLRSVRFGADDRLCEEIATIGSKEDLVDYLKSQSDFDVVSYLSEGRLRGESFDALHSTIKKNTKARGMSNSEAALATALWGASQEGAEINYLCLAAHMTPECEIKNPEILKAKILSTEAIIFSGPVYFGDRGSLAQSFFEYIRTDADLRDHVKNIVFAGLAVGAKRNGGQETTLIYQMVDATNLGMLVVGNGATTTAQYGGTVVAGEVGDMPNDAYGINTAIGTGHRVAEVLKMMKSRGDAELQDVQIGVWILQDDTKANGLSYVHRLCTDIENKVKGVRFVIRNITHDFVYRCIACDLCPACTGPVDEYRCTVKTKDDFFVKNHAELIKDDAILLMAYSPEDANSVISKYQQFIERTRYLRRDNYTLSNRLASAFVISEINANKNLHIRMLTSIIRHNTILHKPVIGYEHQGALLNEEAMKQTLESFAVNARTFAAARLTHFSYTEYNPVGYVISKESLEHNIREGTIDEDRKHREALHQDMLRTRMRAK